MSISLNKAFLNVMQEDITVPDELPDELLNAGELALLLLPI